jgi:hypothetical protein
VRHAEFVEAAEWRTVPRRSSLLEKQNDLIGWRRGAPDKGLCPAWVWVCTDGKVLLTTELNGISRAWRFPAPEDVARRAEVLVRRLKPMAQERACNQIVGVCEER